MSHRLKSSVLPLLWDTAPAAVDPITGTPGPDRNLRGTEQNDVINGLAGNDRLYGLAGADRLNGGGGKDELYGGTGNDRLVLSLGADSINGGLGIDTLDASKLGFGVQVNATASSQGFPSLAANTIKLSNGILQTVTGNWTLNGGLGNDSLHSGHGDTVLYGGAGNDVLDGMDGSNRLYGGDGDDYLEGGLNDAQMFGGNGNDRFTVGAQNFPGTHTARGGNGSDFFSILKAGHFAYGGAGQDTFRFGFANGGKIQDFQAGIDICDLQAFLDSEPEAVTFDDIRGMMTNEGGNTLLKADFVTRKNFEFLFIGVTPDEFSARDFLL